MKKLIFVLILFFSISKTNRSFAQGENNVWAFGDSIGLDFNSGAPTLISTSTLAWESGAAISNLEGKLLFYCGHYQKYKGGSCLWDATHKLMPNGDSLIGNRYTSSTQGVTILPFFDGSNKYYVFVQASRENLWEDKDHYLRYSVVDMDLRGGLGDVIPGLKNIIIDSFISEKLLITKGDGCSVWLINHRTDTNEFHAFKIDYTGIYPTPVISGFPSDKYFSFTFPPEPPYAYANMDIDVNGKRIAFSRYRSPSLIELYDFDKSYGVVSNQRIIDSIFSYWVQFSPDGNKLYSTGPIAQYDLNLLPSLSAVKASRYVLRDTGSFSGMRIGPDNKIYNIVNDNLGSGIIDRYVYRIEFPNLLAPACMIKRYLKLPTSSIGHMGFGPNIIIPPPTDTITSRRDTVICFTPYGTIKADSGYNGYIWNDGTKGRVKTVLTTGKNWVKMRKGCTIYVDTFYHSAKVLDTITNKKDTTICFSRPITIKAASGKGYKWFDNDTNQTKTIISEGVYWVSYFKNECEITIDTLIISDPKKFDSSFSVMDTIVCLAKSITLETNTDYEHFKWYDGSTEITHKISSPGKYWVTHYNNCLIKIDSFIVNEQTNDSSFYKKDSIICFENKILLAAPTAFNNYLWNDGSSSQIKEVSSSGITWVYSFNDDCKIRVDTFNVSFINFSSPLPAIDSICNKDTIILNATTANATYQWQDGSTQSSFNAHKEGKYFVTINVGQCSLTDSVEIFEKELQVSLGEDLKICDGEFVLLEARIDNAYYLWQDGSQNQKLSTTQSGIFWVQVSKENCVAFDTISINVVRCTDCIAIPNAFSPNTDNKNDFFKAIINCPTQEYTLKIFNRYGQEVFSTNNSMDKWDGLFNNRELEVGVYYYFIKVKFDIPNAKEEMYKGDITLIR